MLTAPLESSLIRLDEELKQGALNVFILVSTTRKLQHPQSKRKSTNLHTAYIQIHTAQNQNDSDYPYPQFARRCNVKNCLYY